MNVIKKDYKLVNYNIKDSVGQFTYKVKLSDRIDYDQSTGFLYCIDAVVGNVGVQIYKGSELGFADGNRVVKVHRKKEYIFAEDSLATLEGKPITLDHPNEMVNSGNIRKYGMGTILTVGKKEGDNIVCDLVIQDKELIDQVAPENEDGERAISDDFRDLSLGYNAKLLPYLDTDEFIQTDIEYNHLAVVKYGRAQNAIIRDSIIKKERKPMNFLDLFKGRKLKINDDDTVTVVDEEKVISKTEITENVERIDRYDDDKKITSERKTVEIIKEDDEEDAKIENENDETEKKEKKGETVMKDKAYFTKAFNDAKSLPDGPFKQDTIQELNDEYLEIFPRTVDMKDSQSKVSVTDKIKVLDSKEINPEFKDQKVERIDFAHMEKESKEYYDILTNPESKFHFDHKAWQNFYKSEVKSGQSSLNI